jgi:hypothetical protein
MPPPNLKLASEKAELDIWWRNVIKLKKYKGITPSIEGGMLPDLFSTLQVEKWYINRPLSHSVDEM